MSTRFGGSVFISRSRCMGVKNNFGNNTHDRQKCKIPPQEEEHLMTSQRHGKEVIHSTLSRGTTVYMCTKWQYLQQPRYHMFTKLKRISLMFLFGKNWYFQNKPSSQQFHRKFVWFTHFNWVILLYRYFTLMEVSC